MNEANTHRAFALHTEYDPPRHKLIASGPQGFCIVQAEDYAAKHGMETGVVEAGKLGNPWAAEWPEDKPGRS
ncbi:hypothetical protein [Rhodococcus sp. B10]|uniref:hypothetical protein n=1 Tax=Rhodococcus sp. B10 TaxID=2695876 RepID=UPI00142FAED1|nr:hypothetical protein [Rhodococcus sp. B10]NIL77655.1 hypothetical protein [Rhodococcus sp. B10]